VCPVSNRSTSRQSTPQLPPIAGRVLAEHDPTILAVDHLVFVIDPLESPFDHCQIGPQFDGDVGPCGRTVFGVLAQVDLLAVVALEPRGGDGVVGAERHPLEGKDVAQKIGLGIDATDGASQVDMVKGEHDLNLSPAPIRSPLACVSWLSGHNDLGGRSRPKMIERPGPLPRSLSRTRQRRVSTTPNPTRPRAPFLNPRCPVFVGALPTAECAAHRAQFIITGSLWSRSIRAGRLSSAEPFGRDAPHVQPGVRPACSIHFCSSGRCAPSRLVTFTYRVRSCRSKRGRGLEVGAAEEDDIHGSVVGSYFNDPPEFW
jgi:hypothetical protein